MPSATVTDWKASLILPVCRKSMMARLQVSSPAVPLWNPSGFPRALRLGLELRYPLMLEGSTNIYALAFVEGGNAWSDVKDFNPFDMKRSAGAGVRIFLPMVGLMGIDWAYGFDKVYGSSQYGGSQFHFILGQEF